MISKVLALSAVASTASAFMLNAPAGDEFCAKGFRSTDQLADASLVAVCCPSYCGKCNDYGLRAMKDGKPEGELMQDGCENVRAQDSKNACCASAVRAKACENNSQDPHCLKQCSAKSAPCSLGLHAQLKGKTGKLEGIADDCSQGAKVGAADDYNQAGKDAVKAKNERDQENRTLAKQNAAAAAKNATDAENAKDAANQKRVKDA